MSICQSSLDRGILVPFRETAGEYKEFFETDVIPGAFVFMKKGGVETAVNTGKKHWREICIELK